MTSHSPGSDAPKIRKMGKGYLRTKSGSRRDDVPNVLRFPRQVPARGDKDDNRSISVGIPRGSDLGCGGMSVYTGGTGTASAGRSRIKAPTYNPPALSPELDELARKYAEHLRREGLAAHTIKQRLYVFRCLGVDPSTATLDDVARIFDRELAPASRANYFRCVRMIFADLNRMGLIENGNDPSRLMKPPRTPRRRPRPLPQAEIDRLLEMPDEIARAWTVLGYYAGMRSSEVVSVRGTDLEDSDNGPMLRIIGKGRLDAVIPAHERVVEVLAPFRGYDEVLWPIWAKSMLRRWQKAAAEVGVEGRVFHQLRHTYATRLYRATDGDLLTVAALCRHASVATTQGYAQVAAEAPFSAIRKLA